MSGLPWRAALVALMLAPAAAEAAPRVWISAARGADSPSCGPVSAPCRTLAQAHANVDPGGEIDVLDPGGYGSLVITKAVSVINEGGVAGALSTSAAAIAIEAGASDEILIKGLTIESGAGPLYGVHVKTASRVSILNCLIKGFPVGLRVAPPSGSVKLLVRNSDFISNSNGIHLYPDRGSASVSAAISNTSLSKNTIGLSIEYPFSTGVAEVSIDNSESSLNSLYGIIISGNPGAVPSNATLTIDRSVISNNTNAGLVSEKARVFISNSTIVSNGRNANLAGGVLHQGGVWKDANSANSAVYTFKNNVIRGNTNCDADCGGALTAVTPGD